MKDFQEIFEAYGADYHTTMKRFLGNKAMYLRVLALLPQDKSLENLRKCLEDGNLHSAFEAAHTLKGVSGNLGLTPLYEATCAIVEPLRKQDPDCDYQAKYQTIRLEFERAEELLKYLKEGE